MALGVGLTITNTKAVLEALFGVQSAFARTPKYRVNKKGEKSQAKIYRKRLGIIPWIELAIGCYFTFTVWYAISSENYFTVPFLLLFVLGYWYTGLLSLLQGRFERFSSRPSSTRSTKSPTPSASRQTPHAVNTTNKKLSHLDTNGSGQLVIVRCAVERPCISPLSF